MSNDEDLVPIVEDKGPCPPLEETGTPDAEDNVLRQETDADYSADEKSEDA